MEQDAQGSGHSPQLLEHREHWNTSLRHRIWVLDGSVFSQGLGSMILAGPFQVGTYCDSMILRSDRKRLAEQQPPEPAEGAPAQRCAGNGTAPLRR